MVAPVLLLARVAANDDDAAITQSSTLSDPAGSGVVAAPSQPKGCAFFVHIIVALLALRVARPPGAARSAPRPPRRTRLRCARGGLHGCMMLINNTLSGPAVTAIVPDSQQTIHVSTAL